MQALLGVPRRPRRVHHAAQDLLDAEAIGVTLTESFAMLPAASVSGVYFVYRRELR